MVRRGRQGEATVFFRQTVRQRWSLVVGGLAGIITVQLVGWIATGAHYVHASIYPLGGLVVGGLLGNLTGLGDGATLTPSALEAHGLRRRVIRWQDIQLILVEKRLFTRSVMVYEFSGRRTVLRAPVTGFAFQDKRFEEKYHTIGRWWLEHREIPAGGAEPQDAPPPGFSAINDAVPSTADTVAGDVPPRSSSRLPRRGLT